MKVTIVDYGMGNLQSVSNALAHLGASPCVSNRREDLERADRIVLPGVGAFGVGIQNLRSSGVVEVLREQVLERRKPFIGLCLGMQLLASRGLEHGEHEGLGWIAGTVDRMPTETGNGHLRLPHMGWNEVRPVRPSRLLDGFETAPCFYFVHSYRFRPDSADVVTGVSEYGGEFVATVERDNIFATQFHPEKSHRDGLTLLGNFLRAPAA